MKLVCKCDSFCVNMRQNFMVISVNYLSQLLQLQLKVFKSKQDVTIKVAMEGVYRTKRDCISASHPPSEL